MVDPTEEALFGPPTDILKAMEAPPRAEDWNFPNAAQHWRDQGDHRRPHWGEGDVCGWSAPLI